MNSKKRVLILGCNGMLGHELFKQFSKDSNFVTYGTTRNKTDLPSFLSDSPFVFAHVNAYEYSTIENVIGQVAPDIVINCIGIIKQLKMSSISAIIINSLLPHSLAETCRDSNARLIHFSTDCIFSGATGNYTEDSNSDCIDLYGRTKFLGEVDYYNAFTFRTSIIGHELNSSVSLVDWFLNQSGKTSGYTKAIFSGFPTVEIANILKNYVIPHPELSGVYQISADPINKHALLSLIADVYGKDITIEKNDSVVIDRSLNSSRFKELTGYTSPSWDELIKDMYNNR